MPWMFNDCYDGNDSIMTWGGGGGGGGGGGAVLTHRGREKFAAISQWAFSNVFYWMKMHEFRFSS